MLTLKAKEAFEVAQVVISFLSVLVVPIFL
jgi:hypothetical protein